jgi:hypothetical protein
LTRPSRRSPPRTADASLSSRTRPQGPGSAVPASTAAPSNPRVRRLASASRVAVAPPGPAVAVPCGRARFRASHHLRKLEGLRDGQLQVVDSERLEDELDTVGSEPALLLERFLCRSRAEDDRYVLGLARHAHLLEQLPAGLLTAEQQVHDHQVGTDLGHLRQILGCIRRRADAVPHAGQDVPEELDDLFGVIDDEDMFGRRVLSCQRSILPVAKSTPRRPNTQHGAACRGLSSVCRIT